ncbi:MAG: ABC transporter permease [Alphaproteobacteria bacterium]|nr:ABC transporter permease [Alphaproteobacteria bacterium]
MNPVLKRKIASFKNNKRALTALVLFMIVFILSLFSELLANDKPLVIKYENELYFPIFTEYTDEFFGGDFPTPADYKDPLIVSNIQNNGWMIMPIIPFSYNTVDYEIDAPAPTKPDKTHWLGTDDEGRDIVARILYGIRLSVVFAFILTFVSSLIGIVIGAVQGYFGGKTDIILQRFIEVWESLPQLFILIIIASVFLPNFWTLLIILMLFSWTSLTSMVRAEFLRTRNFEYVKAAKALGVSNFRIIFKHILPNALVTSVTFIPFILSESIVALTSLDFLGLGLSGDYPSLGDLVRQGKDNLQAPWIGVTIFIVLSSLLSMLIFIGEGVRDAFDTRKAK